MGNYRKILIKILPYNIRTIKERKNKLCLQKNRFIIIQL